MIIRAASAGIVKTENEGKVFLVYLQLQTPTYFCLSIEFAAKLVFENSVREADRSFNGRRKCGE